MSLRDAPVPENARIHEHNARTFSHAVSWRELSDCRITRVGTDLRSPAGSARLSLECGPNVYRARTCIEDDDLLEPAVFRGVTEVRLQERGSMDRIVGIRERRKIDV